jgi:hypothetical protein
MDRYNVDELESALCNAPASERRRVCDFLREDLATTTQRTPHAVFKWDARRRSGDDATTVFNTLIARVFWRRVADLVHERAPRGRLYAMLGGDDAYLMMTVDCLEHYYAAVTSAAADVSWEPEFDDAPEPTFYSGPFVPCTEPLLTRLGPTTTTLAPVPGRAWVKASYCTHDYNATNLAEWHMANARANYAAWCRIPVLRTLAELWAGGPPPWRPTPTRFLKAHNLYADAPDGGGVSWPYWCERYNCTRADLEGFEDVVRRRALQGSTLMPEDHHLVSAFARESGFPYDPTVVVHPRYGYIHCPGFIEPHSSTPVDGRTSAAACSVLNALAAGPLAYAAGLFAAWATTSNAAVPNLRGNPVYDAAAPGAPHLLEVLWGHTAGGFLAGAFEEVVVQTARHVFGDRVATALRVFVYVVEALDVLRWRCSTRERAKLLIVKTLVHLLLYCVTFRRPAWVIAYHAAWDAGAFAGGALALRTMVHASAVQCSLLGLLLPFLNPRTLVSNMQSKKTNASATTRVVTTPSRARTAATRAAREKANVVAAAAAEVARAEVLQHAAAQRRANGSSESKEVNRLRAEVKALKRKEASIGPAATLPSPGTGSAARVAGPAACQVVTSRDTTMAATRAPYGSTRSQTFCNQSVTKIQLDNTSGHVTTGFYVDFTNTLYHSARLVAIGPTSPRIIVGDAEPVSSVYIDHPQLENMAKSYALFRNINRSWQLYSESPVLTEAGDLAAWVVPMPAPVSQRFPIAEARGYHNYINGPYKAGMSGNLETMPHGCAMYLPAGTGLHAVPARRGPGSLALIPHSVDSKDLVGRLPEPFLSFFASWRARLTARFGDDPVLGDNLRNLFFCPMRYLTELRRHAASTGRVAVRRPHLDVDVLQLDAAERAALTADEISLAMYVVNYQARVDDWLQMEQGPHAELDSYAIQNCVGYLYDAETDAMEAFGPGNMVPSTLAVASGLAKESVTVLAIDYNFECSCPTSYLSGNVGAHSAYSAMGSSTAKIIGRVVADNISRGKQALESLPAGQITAHVASMALGGMLGAKGLQVLTAAAPGAAPALADANYSASYLSEQAARYASLEISDLSDLALSVTPEEIAAGALTSAVVL